MTIVAKPQLFWTKQHSDKFGFLQDAICSSLEEYNRHINELKTEMKVGQQPPSQALSSYAETWSKDPGYEVGRSDECVLVL